MSKSFLTWLSVGLVVTLTGAYLVIHFLMTPAPSVVDPLFGPQETATPIFSKNPLLTATRDDISKWYLGHCFAELYMKDPSFGGKMIPSCTRSTLEEIKRWTGVQLTKKDLFEPDVIAHLKPLVGGGNEWRL